MRAQLYNIHTYKDHVYVIQDILISDEKQPFFLAKGFLNRHWSYNKVNLDLCQTMWLL